MRNRWLSKISIFIGFLLGTRIFVAALLLFALYVSTFFLFNQEEGFGHFLFDYRVHAIIFCSFFSVIAGGIINQFYDKEKDQLTKPFRTRLQGFLAQRYYLYLYISLNLVSLGVAAMMSPRILLFFIIYQFLMWLYSHKLSKILIVNNFTFVGLTLYPFFGMLVFYRTFSFRLLLMSIFLFLILLAIDIIKDILTQNVDKIFGYQTLANSYSVLVAKVSAASLLLGNIVICFLIWKLRVVHQVMADYFLAGIVVHLLILFLLSRRTRIFSFISLNVLRLWVFLGILFMLIDGIIIHFSK